MKRHFPFLVRRALAPVAALALAVLLSLPTPAPAAPARTPAVTLAGLTDGIIGNRSRMIQVATIGMALAIFILSIGHKQGR